MDANENPSMVTQLDNQSAKMKLSIHTTITNSLDNEYPLLEAIRSYLELADEVVIVDGDIKGPDNVMIRHDFPEALESGKLKVIDLPWPWVYTQKEFPIHLNAGLEACTGDWAMKLDIDHIIHEDSIDGIRSALKRNTEKAFLTIGKLTIIDRFHATLKSKLPIIINLKNEVGKQVRYGIDETDRYNDWSWPVLPNGYFKGDTRIPIGRAIDEDMLAYIRQEFWNYDYFFRTKEIAKTMFARSAKAYRDQTGKALWGANDEQSWAIFSHITESRKKKDMRSIKIEDHPKYIRERVENLSPDCFGFDHWKGNYA